LIVNGVLKSFAPAKLTKYTIPDIVTSIGSNAFYDCDALKSIVIPDSVTSIGDGAFHSCSGLTSVTIGNSVTSIGDIAFYGCTGLTSIVIPDSVTEIGISAFYGCSNLTNVIIGSEVNKIGQYAFANCNKLSKVNCRSINPPEAYIKNSNNLNTEWGAFNNTDLGCEIMVPPNSVSNYKKAPGWINYNIYINADLLDRYKNKERT
jgi:hypothetical protein